MDFKYTATALMISIYALTGCDSSDNSAVETSTMPAPNQNPEDAVTLEGLDGQWNSACTAIADNSLWSTANYSVADNVGTMTERFYTDNACSTDASPAITITENSLAFNGEVSSTSLGDASQVETTAESITTDGEAVSDAVNTITYDIMLITNNTLYFGDKSGAMNGSSADLRPESLDQMRTYSNL